MTLQRRPTSGLVPLTWLADKPGVWHGDHRHIDQMAFWPLNRPGYNTLTWPSHSEVATIKDARHSNHSIASSLIADLAATQLFRRKHQQKIQRCDNYLYDRRYYRVFVLHMNSTLVLSRIKPSLKPESIYI